MWLLYVALAEVALVLGNTRNQQIQKVLLQSGTFLGLVVRPKGPPVGRAGQGSVVLGQRVSASLFVLGLEGDSQPLSGNHNVEKRQQDTSRSGQISRCYLVVSLCGLSAGFTWASPNTMVFLGGKVINLHLTTQVTMKDSGEKR